MLNFGKSQVLVEPQKVTRKTYDRDFLIKNLSINVIANMCKFLIEKKEIRTSKCLGVPTSVNILILGNPFPRLSGHHMFMAPMMELFR